MVVQLWGMCVSGEGGDVNPINLMLSNTENNVSMIARQSI